MIKRRIEHELSKRMKQSPAVVLLGPRQAGKTTLAKNMAQKQKSKSMYFDLENPRDHAKLETDAYTLLEQYSEKCVILDEIQLKPELFSLLRPLIDDHRIPGRFLLLGSASPRLVKGVSESLAGRVSYIHLHPVTLPEALKHKYSQNFHWFTGGFPEILCKQEIKSSQQMMDDLITSYVEQDLSAMFGFDLSPKIMRNFLSMIAKSNG